MKLTRLAVAALGAAALAAAKAAAPGAAPQAGGDKDYLAVIFSPSMARAFTAISASKVLAEGRAYNKCLKAERPISSTPQGLHTWRMGSLWVCRCRDEPAIQRQGAGQGMGRRLGA